MVLSDRRIKDSIASGYIRIEPYDESNVQPSSVDVRLSNLFQVFRNHNQLVIDPREDQRDHMEQIEIDNGDPFVIHPGEFVLGCTYETIRNPNDLVSRLEGKSSLGRLGLIVHATAGYIDPGFVGQITLELSNVANLPILLFPLMKIAQLSFCEMTGLAEIPYGDARLGSKYQRQRGPTPSRMHLNYNPGALGLTDSKE